MNATPDTPGTDRTATCRYCMESVHPKATCCPHCTSDFPVPDPNRTLVPDWVATAAVLAFCVLLAVIVGVMTS